jgi:hypothetical protein
LIKPEDNATSSWYDPSYLKIAYHKPPTFIAEVSGWIAVIIKNIISMILNYEGFTLFAFVAVLYYAVKIKRSDYGVLLGTFLLFSAGYSIYHVEDRYIWFGATLLLLMIANMKIRNVFLYIMLFSFTVLPIKRILSNINYRRDIYTFSKSIHVNGNIASNQEWNNSLYIAYYNYAKYYGIAKGNENDVLKSLKSNHINYFLVWNDGVTYTFLSSQTPIQTSKNITVYKIE